MSDDVNEANAAADSNDINDVYKFTGP